MTYDRAEKFKPSETIVEKCDRLEKENAKLKKQNELFKHGMDRYVPCPNHRDKTKKDHCYVCEVERLNRQNTDLQENNIRRPQPIDIENIKRSLAIEFYGHSVDMWSLPLADHQLIEWLFEQGHLHHDVTDYFGMLVKKARISADKAKAKFPKPNYTTLKIAEEAGEVIRGAVHYAENRMEWSEVEGEIVQLLAMLIRFLTEGDEVNGIKPPTVTED